jgi:hypothetical protein
MVNFIQSESARERNQRFVLDGTQPRLPRHSVAGYVATFLHDLNEPRDVQFKEQLAYFFRSGWAVKRAYFIEIGFPTGGTGRGLCLKITLGDRVAIREKAQELFCGLYTRDEYFDLIFLDQKQEAEVRKTCTPFFEQVDETEDFRNRMPRHTTGLTARVCPHCASRQHGIHRAVRTEKQGEGDSGWRFFCNSGAAEDPSEAHTQPLWRVLETEPLLLRWLDADVGTVVWRPSPKDPWEAWKDGKPVPIEHPRPGKNGKNGNGANALLRPGYGGQGTNGNGTNGHHTNGTNGNGANGNGANGHYTNGTNGNGANGHYTNGANGTNGTNGTYHAAETPKRFEEAEETDDSPRQYLKLQPGHYEAADNLYYECYGCGDALASLSKSGTRCRCGNFSISKETARIMIRDEAKIRVFRQG